MVNSRQRTDRTGPSFGARSCVTVIGRRSVAPASHVKHGHSRIGRLPTWIAVSVILSGSAPNASAAEPISSDRIGAVVDRVVQPLMAANRIPGMAVAVTIDGNAHVFNYGNASTDDRRPVHDGTLFEIGSLSKTFTGMLGAYVEAEGKLALSDPATRYFPEAAGGALDHVSLLELATYTAGGLPLQFPDAVRDEPSMIAFFRDWRPSFPADSARLYSNTSIGLFGYLAARGAGAPFDELMSKTLLPKLGLAHTYLTVPPEIMERYAQGISKDDRPIRVSPGRVDAEAYGIKTTAGDLIRFIEFAMDPSSLEPPLRKAVEVAQTGYYRFGRTLQGLGWEIYDRPLSLDALLAGNAPAMALEPQPVTKLEPPVAPRSGRFVNKTGSTNGFGAYAAFLPERRLGIVILANRAYPIPDRVRAAWSILTQLE